MLQTEDNSWDGLKSTEEGLIDTSNRLGYMLAKPDELMKAFAAFCAKDGRVGVDVGCAYGVATLYALQQMKEKNVQGKIIAVDSSEEHIAKLEELAAVQGLSKQLETRCATYPQQTTFESNSIDAILLSRILHFLTGEQIMQLFKAAFQALVPGGKIYMSTLTPYVACLSQRIGEYEANLKNFLQAKTKQSVWPGEIEDVQQYLTNASHKKQHPTFFHVISPIQLKQALEEIGFQVESCKFSTRPYPDNIQYKYNGVHQEDAIVTAEKPMEMTT